MYAVYNETASMLGSSEYTIKVKILVLACLGQK